MVKKYGMISDIHEDPNIIVPAIERLKDFHVKGLIVDGDIGGNYGSLEKSQQYTGFILDKLAESGLETFVQPGSHETLLGYGHVIEHFADKYDNIIDTTKNPIFSEEDHDLVFLPGSDFLCGGEYQIGNDERIPSGRYIALEEGKFRPFYELREYIDALNKRVAKGAFQYFNMNDLKNQVTDPEKTVIVCHVPRKFDNLETGVDMAEFGDVVEDFETKEGVTKKGTVIPLQFTKPYIDAGAPVVIKKENRGNTDLRDLYEELGIKKAVSGHFHESSHRASDSNGVHIPENTFTNELFWNSGYGDAGHFGVLSVDGTKVSYQNVVLS